MQHQNSLLAGLKVLDITTGAAGPFGGRLLADLGADVINVARPSRDPERGDNPLAAPEDYTTFRPMYNMANGSKRGIAIDLKQPEGQALLQELVPEVDVVLENFAPGVIGRLGLDYETARLLNPKIVMCSVSGYGQTGTLAQLPGVDGIGQALSGMAAMIGEAGGPPLFANNTPVDTVAGTHAALAILASIYHRDRTGESQYIEISLVDSIMAMDAVNLPAMAVEKEPVTMPRTGGHKLTASPMGIFKATDGYIVIGAGGEGPNSPWGKLCRLMGREDLITDPEFAANAGRVRNRAELTAIIEAWLQTLASDEAAVQALRNARILSSPVLDPWHAIHSPLAQERAMLREVEWPGRGKVGMVATPYKLSTAELRVARAPILGEHTVEVLREFLEYEDATIRTLIEQGIVTASTEAMAALTPVG